MNEKIGYWNKDIFIADFEDLEKSIVSSKSANYYNIACSFDIESSTLPYEKADKNKSEFMLCKDFRDASLIDFYNTPVSILYHWQMGFCDGNTEICVMGRTWEEWLSFLSALIEFWGISNNRRIVVYVHFLQYEFQFIQAFFQWETVFARKPRQVIKALAYNGIEFRCSYFLSNMSLKKFCENTEGVIHGKKDGDLDYSKFRTPTTKLTKKELDYCINDALGLAEAIWANINGNIDDVISIPLTSTSYVRREVRARVQNFEYMKMIHKDFPSVACYNLCVMAFRGGDTHANRMWANKNLTNIFSQDLKSSYPAWLLYEEYPCGNAREIIILSLKEYIALCKDSLMVMQVELWGVELHSDVAMPYIDLAHCTQRTKEMEIDNGRILSCDYIVYTCTSIDLNIILQEYDVEDLKFGRVYAWKKAPLDLNLRKAVYDYFARKTLLDGVEGKEYEYMKSKNRVNSVFGMMVSKLYNIEYEYNNGVWCMNEKDIEAVRNKAVYNPSTFLLYQWGLFITAHARYHLHRALTKIGMDAVYIDTDSIKFMNEKHKKVFEEENRKLLERLKTYDGEYKAVTNKGEEKIMGLWEDEGCYQEFKTLGAKKYVVGKTDKDGVYRYHTTVSGLSKEAGMKEIKSIQDFYIGKVFTESGRTTAFYNDIIKPYYVNIKGESILMTPNVGIVDTTYTLGITDSYAELLTKWL